jgi:hypothetical protein
MREYLPGQPSQKRIKEVKAALHRMGIRPLKHTWRGIDLWHATWEWAYQVARSYACPVGRYRPRWPRSSEIASQYVLLLLMHIRDDLRLPFRAETMIPASVKTLVPALGGGFERLSLEMKEIEQCQSLPSSTPLAATRKSRPSPCGSLFASVD